MEREEIIQVAKSEAERRDWPWLEPIVVRWGLFAYTVWTNGNCRGGNAIIKVRKKDGAIVSASMTPL